MKEIRRDIIPGTETVDLDRVEYERLVAQAKIAADLYDAVAAWCKWMDHEPFDEFTANVDTIDDLLHEAYHKAQELDQCPSKE